MTSPHPTLHGYFKSGSDIYKVKDRRKKEKKEKEKIVEEPTEKKKNRKKKIK